ncbi:hypothetical protein Hamer_G010091 [Homarus americanus]|uniref:Uncharacterized protein n=1 Tax=Homarus americanus TaxID=6706 RepID=A0A8J5MXM6_HOMAM|nr:hypothetical protein Hamer_G010091 [Homarus americanus]
MAAELTVTTGGDATACAHSVLWDAYITPVETVWTNGQDNVNAEIVPRRQRASYPVEEWEVGEEPHQEPKKAIPGSPGSTTLEHHQPPCHQHHQHTPSLSHPPHPAPGR